MSKEDRRLPPGPNPRGDLIKEKHNRQLREHMRGRNPAGEDADEFAAADQAEGERSGEPSTKVAHTPGQAEGDRDQAEEEIRRKEERRT